jgi:hypothetical protein
LKGVETDTGIFCYPFLERSNFPIAAFSTEKFAVFKKFYVLSISYGQSFLATGGIFKCLRSFLC